MDVEASAAKEAYASASDHRSVVGSQRNSQHLCATEVRSPDQLHQRFRLIPVFFLNLKCPHPNSFILISRQLLVRKRSSKHAVRPQGEKASRTASTLTHDEMCGLLRRSVYA